MKQLIFQTRPDFTGLLLRLTAAIVLFPHGAQKMLGWFGGYGFSGTMTFFTDTVHLPWLIGFLVIVIEFVGPLFLLAGAATRLWAAFTAILMVGIVITSHLDNGFFMNWFGNQKGEGYEFHLLMIGICLALVVNGGGRYSVDGNVRLGKKERSN